MWLLYLCCFVSLVLAIPEDCIFRRNRAPKRRFPDARLQASGRIAGGKEVETITQYPFAVQVKYIVDFCGGAIISDRYILSSAQCLDDRSPSPECVLVLAGNVVQGEGTEIPIEEFGVHPKWDEPAYRNDIGYLRTVSPIEFRDEIQPTPLHYQEEEDFTVVGWGAHGEYDGRRLNVLNELRMTLEYDFVLCGASFPGISIFGAICAQPVDMDGGICKYDAGDPAVNKDGSLFGLGSFSRGCGLGQGPSVFTYLHTDHMRDYVEETTGVQYDYPKSYRKRSVSV